ILYRGAYQGIGISLGSYADDGVLGTPVSTFVYQGAPIVRFSNRLWLGYEWQFGAAFGWKHSNEEVAENNAVVSTAVTAHMGLGVKLHYRLSDKWQMSVGIGAHHYSNGNTSWPNAGVNT
ncbi:acyloxyacyl hydrolase, partial [Parabacteroides distasonis]